MGDQYFRVKVNNTPNYTEKYIVARVYNSELWYWGSWDALEDAEEAARNTDGVVVRRDSDE